MTNNLNEKFVNAGLRSGDIFIPPSKSDGQRAVLAAGLASGQSTIHNLGVSHDEQQMLINIQQLGAEVSKVDENKLSINGIKNFPKIADLKLGESGLGMRLLIPVLAAHDGEYVLFPEGSLKNRSYRFFEETLPIFGGEIQGNKETHALTVKGEMKGISANVHGSEGSQYISGLLMALPLVNGDSEITVLNLKSKPYVELTLNTLSAFGIEIEHNNLETFKIRGNQNYLATNYVVESDWSSASFWLVASALGNAIKSHNLSRTSKQADRQILEAFNAASCTIQFNETAISVDGTQKKAFTFDATDCPDLFPPLAIFALFCPGISRIKGVHRLADKESDRGQVLISELTKVGARIFMDGDELVIHQCSTFATATLDPHNDHRMAMAFAILALGSENGMTIENPSCVNKSYPRFWDDLAQLSLQ